MGDNVEVDLVILALAIAAIWYFGKKIVSAVPDAISGAYQATKTGLDNADTSVKTSVGAAIDPSGSSAGQYVTGQTVFDAVANDISVATNGVL